MLHYGSVVNNGEALDLQGRTKSWVCVDDCKAARWKRHTQGIVYGHAATLIDKPFGCPLWIPCERFLTCQWFLAWIPDAHNWTNVLISEQFHAIILQFSNFSETLQWIGNKLHVVFPFSYLSELRTQELCLYLFESCISLDYFRAPGLRYTWSQSLKYYIQDHSNSHLLFSGYKEEQICIYLYYLPGEALIHRVWGNYY